MITYTNVHGLSAELIAALRAAAEDYDPGDADISVSRLIAPPRMVALLKQHAVVKDYADLLASFYGTAIHSALERGMPQDGALTEVRLSTEIEGWKVSGKFDRLDLVYGVLRDFKFVSRYEMADGLKPEREQQLNCYAELLRLHGYTVSALEVELLYRDWSKTAAQRSADYPPPAELVPVPMWSRRQCQEFMAERVRAHQQARRELPVCTAEERWEKPSKWAVMKQGRKSALRLFDSRLEACDWAFQNGYANKLLTEFEFTRGAFIEYRPGESTRCLNFCDARSVCSYAKEISQ